MKKLQKGDVVRIKSIEWYNKFNQNGIIFSNLGRNTFNKGMSVYCGQLATIEEVIKGYWIKIDLDEGRFFWDSGFFEEEPISKKLNEEAFNDRDEEISNEEALNIIKEMEKEEKEASKIEEKIEEDKVTSVKKKRGRKPGSKNKPKIIKDESKNSNNISIVNFSFEKEDKFKNFKVTKEQLKEEVERNNIDSEFILKEDFSEKEENFSDLLEEYILEKNLSYREGMLLKSILNKDIINFKKFKDYEIIQSKG